MSTSWVSWLATLRSLVMVLLRVTLWLGLFALVFGGLFTIPAPMIFLFLAIYLSVYYVRRLRSR